MCRETRSSIIERGKNSVQSLPIRTQWLSPKTLTLRYESFCKHYFLLILVFALLVCGNFSVITLMMSKMMSYVIFFLLLLLFLYKYQYLYCNYY